MYNAVKGWSGLGRLREEGENPVIFGWIWDKFAEGAAVRFFSLPLE